MSTDFPNPQTPVLVSTTTASIREHQEEEAPEYLATTEACAAAGVSRATLLKYEADGLIKPLRTRRGIRLYTEADVAAVKRIYAARVARHGKTGFRKGGGL